MCFVTTRIHDKLPQTISAAIFFVSRFYTALVRHLDNAAQGNGTERVVSGVWSPGKRRQYVDKRSALDNIGWSYPVFRNYFRLRDDVTRNSRRKNKMADTSAVLSAVKLDTIFYYYRQHFTSVAVRYSPCTAIYDSAFDTSYTNWSRLSNGPGVTSPDVIDTEHRTGHSITSGEVSNELWIHKTGSVGNITKIFSEEKFTGMNWTTREKAVPNKKGSFNP